MSQASRDAANRERNKLWRFPRLKRRLPKFAVAMNPSESEIAGERVALKLVRGGE